MEEKFDPKEAAEAVAKQLESLKNKEYLDWDSLVINICHGESSKASIRMMRQDMEAMAVTHEVDRGKIVDLMIQGLEDEYRQHLNKES
jgi:hypothetical protein